MDKAQRYRYEMLARVSHFGTDHKDLFPESSMGGHRFADVTAAVAAIDANLEGSILARAEARRMKATTRAAVVNAMKTIALTARRMLRAEPGENPFRIPRHGSFKVEVATAKIFIQAAKARQEQFTSFGLPATFISDLESRVSEMQKALDLRLNSKTSRRRATVGLNTAIARGVEAARDLDAIVMNAASENPVVFAAWQAARQIEGRSSSAPADATTPAASAATPAAPDPATVLGKAS